MHAPPDWLADFAQRHPEPYALICLYVRTLPESEQEALGMSFAKELALRFGAKTLRGLCEQGWVELETERMEVLFTPEGLAKVQAWMDAIRSGE
jgi:hypothetical protein